MEFERYDKTISQIVDQSIEQAALLLNYDQIFTSIVASEIKNETDSITKLTKLIHILIEQLTSYQNTSKNTNLKSFQSSIYYVYPNAPKEISHLLKWIPKKMAKEKQKIDSYRKNRPIHIQETDALIKSQKKEEQLKQEIEQLKFKCSHITNSLNLIKENFEKINEPDNNYIEDIKQLKQANIELHENLANVKMQNKLLKSKISSLKKLRNVNQKSVQTQISNINSKPPQTQPNAEKNEANINYEKPDDKYDVIFYELKTLRIEKERSEKKYLANIEYSTCLEEKLKKVQIERDSLQAKLNDQLNLMKKKEEQLLKESEKCEKLSQSCLRLETQITKLKDKLNQQTESYCPMYTNNFAIEEPNQTNDLKNVDIMINPFEIEFK